MTQQKKQIRWHALVTLRERNILHKFLTDNGWRTQSDFVRLAVIRSMVESNTLPLKVQDELRKSIAEIEAKNVNNIIF